MRNFIGNLSECIHCVLTRKIKLLFALLILPTLPCLSNAFVNVTHDTSAFRDLDRLVMDYLVIEGYKSAAEEFCQEAGLDPPVDFQSIESRVEIREALRRGDVESAITQVNDLNPEVSRDSVFSSSSLLHPEQDTKIKLFHAPL